MRNKPPRNISHKARSHEKNGIGVSNYIGTFPPVGDLILSEKPCVVNVDIPIVQIRKERHRQLAV